MIKEIGQIQSLSHKGYIEWHIDDFFSATDRIFGCESPVFFVADVSWRLRLCFWGAELNIIELLLQANEEREYSVNYHFGLKKYDGSIEQFGSGLMKGNVICSDEGLFVNKTKLRLRMSELVPDDVLSITCFIKLMTESRLDESKVNFKDSCNYEDVCDGISEVKGRMCISYVSDFLSLISDFAVTNLPLFQKCLNYINFSTIKELSLHSVLNLYAMSNKYNMEKLKKFCVSYVMHCLTVENLSEIAVFADKYNEAQLFSTVQDYFNLNHVYIFLNPKWKSLLRTDIELANKLLLEMSFQNFRKVLKA